MRADEDNDSDALPRLAVEGTVPIIARCQYSSQEASPGVSTRVKMIASRRE